MGVNPVALYSAVYKDVSKLLLGNENFSHSEQAWCAPRQFSASYLLSSVIRKWIPRDSREADRVAYDAFTSANNSCKEWNFSPKWEVDLLVLGEIRRILDDFFHPGGEPLIGSYFDLLRSGRPGPGVNVGSIGTSYYTKYLASPLSTTSLYLYEEYRRYSSWIPFLSEAECLRYDKYGSPAIVSGSRFSFVPKTSKTSRLICIEPSLNMYYQLGLGAFMTERLRIYFNVDLATQPKVNSRLARQGSIDNSYATIDLSSASDSISIRLCEMLLPRWLFELLLQLRSRTATIGSETVPLFMISTMGNGFTFPLQTIIFSSILSAVSSIFSQREEHKTWSCFGDDLICHRFLYDRVKYYLNLFGFRVNVEKTFFEGPFRESCGTDWFSGQPVRPVFVRKLDTVQDVFVAINSLNDWSSYTGISLRNAISFLLSLIRPKDLTFVPFDSAMDEGVRVPLSVWRPKVDRNLSFVFKTWYREPSIIRILDAGVRYPGKLKGLEFYNPPGLYCSFLFGELGSAGIMVRHNRKIFRRKLRCSPYWDYIPVGSCTNGVQLSWQQWETAVAINLAKS